MSVDFRDPDARRALCTGLSILLGQYAPQQATIGDLVADNAPRLTQEECEMITKYFGADKKVCDL